MKKKQVVTYSIIGLALVGAVSVVSMNGSSLRGSAIPGDIIGTPAASEPKKVCLCDCVGKLGGAYNDERCTKKTPTVTVDINGGSCSDLKQSCGQFVLQRVGFDSFGFPICPNGKVTGLVPGGALCCSPSADGVTDCRDLPVAEPGFVE